MNVTDITTPSNNLPDTLPDDEVKGHMQEDQELWAFVAFVYAFCNGNNPKEQFLRKEAEVFLDWDDKHNDRIRWYA